MKLTEIGRLKMRMGRVFPTSRPKALFVDLSLIDGGIASGGTGDFTGCAEAVKDSVDGLIVTQGQIDSHAALFSGLRRPRVLVRLDTIGPSPEAGTAEKSEKAQYRILSESRVALHSGADGVVVSHVLGYGDDMEIESLRHLTDVVRECWYEGLPVFADLFPYGPDIAPARFDQAVEMGVSVAVETGADGVLMPTVGRGAYDHIVGFCPVPILVRVKDPRAPAEDLLGAGSARVKGVVFGHEFLAEGVPGEILSRFGARATHDG